MEQGAFELEGWRLFAGRLGQQGAALEKHEPGGGLEEVGAELDIGFTRLLHIAEVLPGDLGDRQRVERVLAAAYEREQHIEWSIEAGKRNRHHGARLRDASGPPWRHCS